MRSGRRNSSVVRQVLAEIITNGPPPTETKTHNMMEGVKLREAVKYL